MRHQDSPPEPKGVQISICFDVMEAYLFKNKQDLRTHIRQQRQQLSEAFQKQAAGAICKQLVNLSNYQQASSIALYLTHEAEVDTQAIIQAATQNDKIIALPVIEAQYLLSFYPYAPGDVLQNNKYGIAEPNAKQLNAIPLQAIDLLIMPLLAFDKEGHRIGQGAGYYDRTLATLSKQERPYLCGIAYELQKVDHIDTDAWDIDLDAVVTEEQIYTR